MASHDAMKVGIVLAMESGEWTIRVTIYRDRGVIRELGPIL
jgi:hypothetical protein